MKKFGICAAIVFLLGIWAEWLIFSNPSKGVVHYIKYQPRTDSYHLYVVNSDGLPMDINMPSKVWREWLQPRIIEEK